MSLRYLIPVLIVVFFPYTAFAATLSLSPQSGTYAAGDRITVRINVSSDSSINAVSGSLTFPRALFSVESLSKASSIINFWASEPTYSNSAGTIDFEGVSLAGYQGSGGRVLSITLRTLKEGIGKISFQTGHVHANDGHGTDVTSGLSGATFDVTPAAPAPAHIEPAPTTTTTVVATSTPAEEKKALVIAVSERDGVQIVFGTSAYANRRITLSFVGIDGSKLLVTHVTDGTGTFVVPLPTGLRNGNYVVTASVLDKSGNDLEDSNALSVTIGATGTETLWMWIFVAMLVVIILLLVIMTLFWHDLVRNRKIQRKFTHEMQEAQTTLHKSFEILRQDLSDRMKEVKTKGAGATGEKAAILDLKKDLEQAEGVIGKEISDIGAPGK